MQSTNGRGFAGIAAATIQLYSRLWWDLEEIGGRIDAGPGPRHAALDLRLEMLRLELIVLLDGCESSRWKALLPPAQRQLLRATLGKLAATLAVPASELEHRIVAAAQNQLFDAVLRHCPDQAPQSLRASM